MVGVIEFKDYTRITVADIPGLIEGAGECRPWSLFLRHMRELKS